MRQSSRYVVFALVVFSFAAAFPTLAQGPHLVSAPASPLSDTALGEAPGRQFERVLLPISDGWIAIWSDEVYRYADMRLLATRLRSDGSVVDPVGIRVADGFTWQSWAFGAVPDPIGVRVFWALPGENATVLRTVTIDESGERSDEIVIGELPSGISLISLRAAVSGSRSAVLVDRYLMILENTRLLRTIDIGGWSRWGEAGIVATNSNFVVTWTAEGGILMRQTLDFDGNTIGPAGGLGSATSAGPHALASDGTNALMVWRDITREGQYGDAIHVSIIDPSSGTFTETAVTRHPGGWVQAVWTDSSYLVSWSSLEGGAIFGLHVSPTGAILDAEPMLLASRQHNHFVIGARNRDLAMIYSAETCAWPCYDDDVYATILGTGGDAADDALISAAARAQTGRGGASDGTSFLTLWSEGHEFFATETLPASNTPSARIALPRALDWHPNRVPVASNGSSYLTAWGEGQGPGSTRVKAAILSRVGATLTPAVLPFDLGLVDQVDATIAIGTSREMYLVAWEFENSTQAARVGADGTMIDTVPITLGGSGYTLDPEPIAFDGDDFIVITREVVGEIGDFSTIERLITQRVTPSGSARLDRTWTTMDYGLIRGSSLACSSDGVCLMVWSAQHYPGLCQLLGQRFRRGGELIDASPFVIDIAEFEQHALMAAWNGSRFILTWGKDVNDYANKRVEARTIGATGVVEQTAPDLLLTHKGWLSYNPAVTCNHQGRCMIVSADDVDDSKLGRTWRLFKRFFGETRPRPARR